MIAVQTHRGVVREGKIQLTSTTELPEGSHVYVIVAGPDPIVEEQIAQRKATRWLVEYVGNMMVSDEGHLVETDGRLVWRFGAFITRRGHKPRGPVGYVDVEAHTSEVLMTEQQAEEMIAHGATFARTLLQTA